MNDYTSFKIRISQKLKEEINNAYKNTGMSSASDWIRVQLLSAARADYIPQCDTVLAETKPVMLDIRVNESQAVEIRTAIEKSGFSQSDWIRSVLMRVIGESKK